ncbi:SMI1/KNR4 family protein [Thalassobius sp. I31.1]|uniref:SMI1/KNR4 family protein n=1 Tax=Thalassobius sp. I31.1 TaxID=2109912 RepID=UPI001300BB93|nr:SMI1/KNR4 family protein [Thalassobius sp. I31.1]
MIRRRIFSKGLLAAMLAGFSVLKGRNAQASEDVLAAFIQRWCHPDHPADPVAPGAFDILEQELGVKLPSDYKELLLRNGRPSPTLRLLTAVVDHPVAWWQAYLPDLAALTDPSEISEDTKTWQEAGMPDHFLKFGWDSLGNAFCFRLDELGSRNGAPAEVWFWDHDLGDSFKVADSFTALIERYLALPDPVSDLD